MKLKLKIKPYLYRLLKENILYIISFLLLIFLNILILIIGINKLINLNNEVKKISTEVSDLKNRYKFYFQSQDLVEEKLIEDIKMLNRLIPDVEDYFSIIYALEKLSQKTGFYIISYSVDVSKSTKDKLRLSVSGVGDSVSFLNFLESYNFGGERLITSDKIEYNSQASGAIKLNLTFYNKNISLSAVGNQLYGQEIPKEDIFAEIEAIKSKVDFSFSQEPVAEDFNYQKKSNPFQ